MQLRFDLRAALLTALVVGSAQACPNHPVMTAAAVTPRTLASPALVAWKPRAWTPLAAAARISQGLRVAIDPVDGTFGMPAPDELSQQVLVGDHSPVAVIRRSNGSLRAQLDERFAEFAVVTLGADGLPRWTCVKGPAGAEQFMKHPVVKAAAPAPAPGTVWEDK